MVQIVYLKVQKWVFYNFYIIFRVYIAYTRKKSKMAIWGSIEMEVPFIKYTANYLCRAALKWDLTLLASWLCLENTACVKLLKFDYNHLVSKWIFSNFFVEIFESNFFQVFRKVQIAK